MIAFDEKLKKAITELWKLIDSSDSTESEIKEWVEGLDNQICKHILQEFAITARKEK